MTDPQKLKKDHIRKNEWSIVLFAILGLVTIPTIIGPIICLAFILWFHSKIVKIKEEPHRITLRRWELVQSGVSGQEVDAVLANEQGERDKKARMEEYERKKLEEQEAKEKVEQENRAVKEAEFSQYQQLRKEIEAMPQYQIWRQEVLNKFGKKCAVCGSTENIEVDHRYKSFYRIIMENRIMNVMQAYECPELWDVNNGAPLCKLHHDQTQNSQYYNSLIKP